MVLSHWIGGMPMRRIEEASTTNAWQGKISSGHVRQFADATRFHLRSAANIASLLLVNGPKPESMDALLKQLETGLPLTALGLLALPVELTRGEYLGLLAEGVKSVETLKSFSRDALIKVIGKRRAEILLNSLSHLSPSATRHAAADDMKHGLGD
jgi:helicase